MPHEDDCPNLFRSLISVKRHLTPMCVKSQVLHHEDDSPNLLRALMLRRRASHSTPMCLRSEVIPHEDDSQDWFRSLNFVKGHLTPMGLRS